MLLVRRIRSFEMQIKKILEMNFNKKGGQKPPLESVNVITTRIAKSVVSSLKNRNFRVKLFFPLNTFAGAFIHFFLNDFPVFLGDRSLIYHFSSDMSFRSVIVIHLKIFRKIVCTLIAGRAVVLIYIRNFSRHRLRFSWVGLPVA